MHNRKVHDAIAQSYDQVHHEIHNATEQARIKAVIGEAVSAVRTEGNRTYLDFGAGTGNLTRHLLGHPGDVIAADISVQSLNELRRKHPGREALHLLQLDGLDLSSIHDSSVDMVATYSVLHHVPDYLATVREFCRVLKPSGVIYIDHECSPQFWNAGHDEYAEYEKELKAANGKAIGRSLRRKATKLFSLLAWRRLVERTLFGLNNEGDIHVTSQDHIDWARVDAVLAVEHDLVLRRDYLLCRGNGAAAVVYDKFAERCGDMRFVIYRKKIGAA